MHSIYDNGAFDSGSSEVIAGPTYTTTDRTGSEVTGQESFRVGSADPYNASANGGPRIGGGDGSAAISGLSPIFGIAVQLIGQYLSYNYSKKLASYYSELQEAQAQRDYNRQLELLENMREYDLPVNLVARLRQAGLSPGAMLSAGGTSITSTSAPSGASHGIPTGSVPGLETSALMNPLAQAQARLLNAQASKLEAETPAREDFESYYSSRIATNLARAGQSRAQEAYTQFALDLQKALEQTTIDTAEANLDSINAGILRTLSAARLDQVRGDQLRDLVLSQIAGRSLIEWKIKQIQKGIEVDDATINLINQKIQTEISQGNFLDNRASQAFTETLREGQEYDYFVTDRWLNRALKIVDFSERISRIYKNLTRP